MTAPAPHEAALFERLRGALARAKTSAPYWRETLKDVDPAAVTDRAALAALPLLRKSDLIDLQEASPPFGGLAAVETGGARRLFLSPGPIAEPEGRENRNTDAAAPGTSVWRLERALRAAGFKAGDRAANCFSYHVTPAGIMFDAACGTLGCAVFPGGVGQTETQVEAFHRFSLNAYVGTPDHLRTIMEKADELGRPITGVEKALVTGGPLFPDLRAWYQKRGAAVRQCYATAELGLISYETENPADGMALDEDCIVEIVRTGSGDPAAEGETGEVVVTTFHAAYPLFRLATGDLSAFIPDVAGGAPRLKGWMGRADQTAKVRGMFVHPRQVARAAAGFPEILKTRLEITEREGRDEMRLLCETGGAGGPDGPDADNLAERAAEAVRIECGLRAEIVFVKPGELPNDGVVIADLRK
ncbi:MAG: phenylacetate--CoA ligase family protein [Rhodospirillales bacterium]